MDPAVTTTWTLDASVVVPPRWTLAAHMIKARRNHNLVVLPDGKVLAVGGNLRLNTDVEDDPDDPDDDPYAYPVYEPEIYDPVNDTWTLQTNGSDNNWPRWYHSTAILLPDGRVVSAGGNGCRTGQIFKPPYLMVPGAIRTSIVIAPAYMQYGERYQIRYNTNDGPAATRACLMRPGATTHGFDQDQRRVPLEIVVPSPLEDFEPLSGPASLRVRAPADGNTAPPGYYMLFIMSEQDGQWVPCEMAGWVQVGP